MERLEAVLREFFDSWEKRINGEWLPPVGPMERRFLGALKQMNPGWVVKFDTQVNVGQYYIDIALWVRTFKGTAKIAIEIDGPEHRENWEKDMTRSLYLQENGWKVLRFWNEDVYTNPEACVAQVAKVVVGWYEYELQGWKNPYVCTAG